MTISYQRNRLFSNLMTKLSKMFTVCWIKLITIGCFMEPQSNFQG